MKKSCYNCEFYIAGECHFNAPISASIPAAMMSRITTHLKDGAYGSDVVPCDFKTVHSAWPRVNHDDWCGQFEPVEEKSNG